MPVYLCRWPNGEFSIVSARSRADAIVLLDEWGNAEQAQIFRMKDCMFDFRLDEDGDIELAQIGEATEEHIIEKCYPVLSGAFSAAEVDETGGYTEDSRAAIREAVEKERTRLWDSQPEPRQAHTELGRQIQKLTGAPSVVADRVVEEWITTSV